MNMAAWHDHIMTCHYETKCVYKLSREGKWDLITFLRKHNTFRELPGVPADQVRIVLLEKWKHLYEGY